MWKYEVMTKWQTDCDLCLNALHNMIVGLSMSE